MALPKDQKSSDDLISVHQVRKRFYLSLSRTFMREVDKDFLQDLLENLRSLKDLLDLMHISQDKDIQKGRYLVTCFIQEIRHTKEDIILRDLARDYAALFLGVGLATVALCESVYQSYSGLLFQDSYFQVKERYQDIGLTKNGDYPEPEDHLSVELAYMANLCQLSIDSIERRTGEHPFYHRLQKDFLEKHLMRWVPEFSKTLIETSNSTFYRAMTYLLRGYIKADWNFINRNILAL
jgi:TorA maturation chaperone TorD